MNLPVTRFAPSPTGRLHVGHAYSAVRAHDFARAHHGAFLLRIEDIDAGRARPEHIDGIIEDLGWLGLSWDDEIVYQSDRLPLYAEALDRLKAQGLVYPCFCTRSAIRAEIAASVSAPHGPDGPLYPGTCRALPRPEQERRLSSPHAWRLDVAKALDHLLPGERRGPATDPFPGERRSPSTDPFPVEGRGPATESGLHPGLRRETLTWHDSAAGTVLARPEMFGDVVLARKDAPASYHLAVTVDDAAQGITDIVRGRDLFEATHVHRLLQALLGLPTPDYHHHPLLADASGRRLAKRSGAPALADLRAAGADPRAMLADLRSGRLPAGYSAA